MIEEPELQEILGLSDDDFKILVTIARNQDSTIGNLSTVSGIERGKVYRTLEVLKNLGLVKTSFDNPTRVSLVDSQEMLVGLESRLNNEVIQKTDGYLMFVNYVHEMRVKGENNASVEFTVIRGTENVWAAISKKIKLAEKSIVFLVSKQEFIRMAHSSIYDDLEKSECDITIITDDGEYDIAQKENIKFISNNNSIQGKIVMIDEVLVMFGNTGKKYNDVNDKIVTTTIDEVVNQYKVILNETS